MVMIFDQNFILGVIKMLIKSGRWCHLGLINEWPDIEEHCIYGNIFNIGF